MAAQVFVDIRNAFALISGQHRPGVAHGGKALQHLAGYPLGRRRGQDGSVSRSRAASSSYSRS